LPHPARQLHLKQRARQTLDHITRWPPTKLPVPVCSRSVPSDSSTPARVTSDGRSRAPVEDSSVASDQKKRH
ncbi:hypothetical protein FIBSPDRAFT_873959, partial [Athelia psychrophila]